jgi:hypothetical protein
MVEILYPFKSDRDRFLRTIGIDPNTFDCHAEDPPIDIAQDTTRVDEKLSSHQEWLFKFSNWAFKPSVRPANAWQTDLTTGTNRKITNGTETLDIHISVLTLKNILKSANMRGKFTGSAKIDSIRQDGKVITESYETSVEYQRIRNEYFSLFVSTSGKRDILAEIAFSTNMLVGAEWNFSGSNLDPIQTHEHSISLALMGAITRYDNLEGITGENTESNNRLSLRFKNYECVHLDFMPKDQCIKFFLYTYLQPSIALINDETDNEWLWASGFKSSSHDIIGKVDVAIDVPLGRIGLKAAESVVHNFREELPPSVLKRTDTLQSLSLVFKF